jgi:hypothetical protein
MLQVELRIHVDFRYPTIIDHGFLGIPIFPSGDFVYERGDVDRLGAIKPWRPFQKGVFSPFPKVIVVEA